MSKIDRIRERLHQLGVHRLCRVGYEPYREIIPMRDGSVLDVTNQGRVRTVHR